MGEAAETAFHRRALIRLLGLAPIGIGRCPDCRQVAEIFSHRRATPGASKERCLECWRSTR